MHTVNTTPLTTSLTILRKNVIATITVMHSQVH